ncbi:CPK27, partial [Symbiodinium sp. KB8]
AWIARANHVPLDTCLQAADLFLEQVAALEKNLNIDQFGKCLLHCTGMDSLDELPQNLLRHAFAVADKDKNGSISFPEFVTWFSTVGFNTNVTLSAKERSFREFCAENALSLVDMDRYKKYFAEYDMDESGEIDQEEFEALIRRCARVPRHLEIPATRMKQFWAQADCDQSGSIDFEEFALFYRKFFEADGVGGFESFYRNVRPPLGMVAWQ